MKYKVYTTNGSYIVTPDDPAQTIRCDLSDLLQLWARLDAFIRDQQPDGTIAVTDPLASATEVLDMPDALALAVEVGHDIKERTLRWNLNEGNVPGAIKDGGRWKLPRAQFLEWLRNR
jgi:hypothetical protein